MKNKTLYLTKLSIRSDAPDGGSVPDDEVLCDFVISTDDEDTYNSHMTEQTLRNYAEDANKGVPFMLSHENDLHMQIGITKRAEYDETNKRTTAVVSMLRDTENTPDNMKIDEYIRRIERGYYNSVSVGFRDADEICNICNKDIFDWQRNDPCSHIPGRSYDGVKCTYRVDNARLREVSLVTTPSNPNAKLLDTREWSEDLIKVKQEGDHKTTEEPKTLLERDGQKYREQLINNAIKEGIRAEDNFDETIWRSRFSEMDSEFIAAQTLTWTKLGDARWGEGGRKTEPTQTPNLNNRQSIWLPDHLFEVY